MLQTTSKVYVRLVVVSASETWARIEPETSNRITWLGPYLDEAAARDAVRREADTKNWQVYWRI